MPIRGEFLLIAVDKAGEVLKTKRLTDEFAFTPDSADAFKAKTKAARVYYATREDRT